jgi:DNA repair exonuclease SbcCD nuclease subunit
MKFVHTSDWQIGAPFARISDPYKRSLVQQARIEVIKRMGAVAREEQAQFVLVVGDLFDSPSADKGSVSHACSAIGQVGLPVIVIPGNHDNGGPGSVWEQDFFRREQAELAPNLVVLLEPAPYELDSAVILPCPLLRRTVVADPTEWLRAPGAYKDLPAGKPRIVLAHGSTQAFSGEWEDEGEATPTTNLIDLDRLPDAEVDYVALGDWHGTKQVSAKVWYSGTPEPDRFAKGADNDPGNVLVVEAGRGTPPRVTKVRTAKLGWLDVSYSFADDSELPKVEIQLASLLGQRANEDLLRLSLDGVLGIEAYGRLESVLESLEARLLRLKLADRTTLAPTSEEIEALTQCGGDPLVARVAGQLVGLSGGDSPEAADARVALRELYYARTQEAGR